MAYDDPLQSLQASPLLSMLQPSAVTAAVNMVELVAIPVAPDVFAGQQLAHQFHWEVEQRQAFEDYCQWYAAIALQNQQEMAAMANDLDVCAWFRRRR